MDETTTNVASAGLGLASLIPGVGPFAAIAGLGLSALGAVGKASAAKKSAEASKQIAALEQQQEDVRRRAMEASARRQDLEILRTQQRMAALATNNAYTQGAGFGSGLQGGLGQIAGQTNFNLQGVQDQLSLGRENFGLSGQISQQKMNIASAGSQAATATGLSALGSTLVTSAPTIKNLSTTYLGSNSPLMPTFGLPGGKGWGG